MCYAIPARVIKIKERFATVEYFGRKRKVLKDLLDFDIGDYVYVQAGMAIRKIPHAQARSILKTWKVLFGKLKNQDESLVNQSYPALRLSKPYDTIIKKIDEKRRLSADDCLYLLNGVSSDEAKFSQQLANRIRNKYIDNSCCIHGIIEISNYCARDCLYCGIRNSNKKLKRYRLKVNQILKAVDYAVNSRGFKVLVLQSGEDAYYTKARVLEIIRKIRKKYAVLIFLSLGERAKSDYRAFFDAGARGALLRFESANPETYAALRPGRELEKRLKLIKSLKEMGYLVATGFLSGLPGETDRDILDNIMLTKRLGPEMYSFGPLIPHPETPLASLKKIELTKMLRVISLTRLIDKKSRILVTTATEVLAKAAKEKALSAGANSLMINVTPMDFRGLYDIYPNRRSRDITPEAHIARNLKLLYRLGRAPTDIGIQ